MLESELILTNIFTPIRLYAILSAIIAIVAHYLPDIPTPLFLALVAAVLGLPAVAAEKTVQAKTETAKQEARADVLRAQPPGFPTAPAGPSA